MILRNTTGSSSFHGEGSSKLQNTVRIASEVSRCLDIDDHSKYRQDHAVPYYDVKLPTSIPFHLSTKLKFEAFGLSDPTYWNCAKHIQKEIIDSGFYARKFCLPDYSKYDDSTELEWISKCQTGTTINDIKRIIANSDEGLECTMKKEITTLYHTIFCREPDELGLRNHVADVVNGRRTFNDIKIGFQNSNERLKIGQKCEEWLKMHPLSITPSGTHPSMNYNSNIGFPHELLFCFRGSIKEHQLEYSHGVRQVLYKLYGTPTDLGKEHSGYITYGLPGKIVVAGGGSPEQYTKDMQRSTFCLAPGGYWAFTPRPERAVSLGCIPVILSDSVRLPGGTWLEWNAFSIRIDINEILNDPLSLERTLRSISKTKVQELRKNVIRASQLLMWSDRPFDVLDWVLGQAYISSQHAIQTGWRRSSGNRIVPWRQNGVRQCRVPTHEAKRNYAALLNESLFVDK